MSNPVAVEPTPTLTPTTFWCDVTGHSGRVRASFRYQRDDDEGDPEQSRGGRAEYDVKIIPSFER
jgi:hypothetical protein